MFELIENNQMNIMLCLCSVCAVMTVMLLLTKFLSVKRKWILIALEIIATLLLFFDRLAYIYSGNASSTAYVMVRLSNFMVFFMTDAIVYCFNFYLIDLLKNEGKLISVPRRLTVTGFISALGMLLVIISAFTGFYYTFDSNNCYHRGPGFLLCYLVPVICPITQYTAMFKHRKKISRFINVAIFLYVFLPILTGVIQIFAYGISIVNMTMVLVSVSLYFFTYLDVNAAVEKAHQIEIQYFKDEQKGLKDFFTQAARAFTCVLEKDNPKIKGLSEYTARIAMELAKKAGKNEEECENIYYAAFVCDAGEDALSYITEYPFLSEAARYAGEKYNPDLPESSRIIAVAKTYTTLINDNTLPKFFVRDELIRIAGEQLDPEYTRFAIQLLDEGTLNGIFEETEKKMQSELLCNSYRENVALGIKIPNQYSEISFVCTPNNSDVAKSSFELQKFFSAPSIILFDSYDAQVHENAKEIEANKYLEYGEIWFDSHVICTCAKNMEVRNITEVQDISSNIYKITAGRFSDHLLLKMQSPSKAFEVIVALPSESKSAYIGLTGENVKISDIKIENTEREVLENEIPRISEKINYIDRIESDIPNIQIVNPLAAYTKGILVKDKMKLFFHAKSLPDANLVWHCPYIILYYSDDKEIHGKNYREYAMIKLDGEDNGSNEFAENTFMMKKTEFFQNWEEWESQNKAGFECHVEFYKNGNEVTLKTQDKGIYIQNTTKIKDGSKEIYVSLSGDQIALTDIRVR